LSTGNSALALTDTAFNHGVGLLQHLALVYENGIVTNFVNGIKELTGKVNFNPIADGQISIGVKQTQKSWFKGVIKTTKFTPGLLKPYEFIKQEKN
jgi:hypothetical protein